MIDLGCTGPSKLGAAFWPVPQLESLGSYFRSTWGPSALIDVMKAAILPAGGVTLRLV